MNHNEIAIKLCGELFRDSNTRVVVISHVDIELSGIAKPEKKRQHQKLDEFRTGLGLANNISSFLRSAPETVGLYCCDDLKTAQTTISNIYQNLHAKNAHDGYNLFHPTDDVGVLEIWLDR